VAPGCKEEPLEGDDVEWVSIPAGTFVMGCLAGDQDCDGFGALYGESPPHSVDVPAFEMTRTEVTQYQYWKETSEQPSSHPTCGDCPVEYMENHYQDAKAFCESLGGRLPSEAEWEYAARSGSSTVYSCGSDIACLEQIAWHASNATQEDGERHPQPVAQKAPNAFGLYDMFGNVQEWTEDCSHDDFQGAPTDGSAWMEGGDCTRHVFKGSTYNTEIGRDGTGWMGRPSGRYWDPVDIRGIADGFRCARDIK
jgi:formylglycine-generating enzyme required for sulfatase activity